MKLTKTPKSSWIKAFSHNRTNKVLRVKIKRGKTPPVDYFLHGVPEAVAKDFAASDSKGSFYTKHLRGKYKTFKNQRVS